MSVIDAIALWAGRVLAWVFPVIAAMMGWEVIARYAFNAPTYWAHEIAGLAAAVAFVFGGAYVMAERSHMRVTLLLERMPRPVRRAAEALSLLAGTVFLLGLSVAMWAMVERSALRFTPDGAWNPELSGTSWNTPAPAFLKIALLVGAVLFLLVVLRQAVGLLRGEDPDTGKAPDA